MNRIKKISISNYRSCLKTQFEVSENLTTLIGVNGSGKSNILNAIQLLKKINRINRFIPYGKAKQQKISVIDFCFDFGNETYNVIADIYYITNEKNFDEVLTAKLKTKNITNIKSNWISIDENLFNAASYILENKIVEEGVIANVLLQTEKTKEELYTAITILNFFNNISYYSATMFSDPTKCPRLMELQDIGFTRTKYNNSPHEQFIYDLYRTYITNQNSYRRYINTVNQNGIGLIDDIFLPPNNKGETIKIKVGDNIVEKEIDKIILYPRIFIDGIDLDTNQLSEGTFKTLALIFYILNDESDLLLIEEPEVCVHHGLLNSVIELIKLQSKYKQIFVSTHSDYVLDKLKPENILLVKKNKEKGTVANSLKKSMATDDFKALKEYLKEEGSLGEYWKEGGFGD